MRLHSRARVASLSLSASLGLWAPVQPPILEASARPGRPGRSVDGRCGQVVVEFFFLPTEAERQIAGAFVRSHRTRRLKATIAAIAARAAQGLLPLAVRGAGPRERSGLASSRHHWQSYPAAWRPKGVSEKRGSADGPGAEAQGHRHLCAGLVAGRSHPGILQGSARQAVLGLHRRLAKREGRRQDGVSWQVCVALFWNSGEQLEADGLSRRICFNFVLYTCRHVAGLQTPLCVLREKKTP